MRLDVAVHERLAGGVVQVVQRTGDAEGDAHAVEGREGGLGGVLGGGGRGEGLTRTGE